MASQASIRDVEKRLELRQRWASLPKPQPPFDRPSNKNKVEDLPMLYELIALALQTAILETLGQHRKNQQEELDLWLEDLESAPSLPAPEANTVGSASTLRLSLGEEETSADCLAVVMNERSWQGAWIAALGTQVVSATPIGVAVTR